MMYAPLFVNLVVAAATFCLAINTTEEIVKVAAAFVSLLSSFLSLLFAPWPVKLLILLLPFLGRRLRHARNLFGKIES